MLRGLEACREGKKTMRKPTTSLFYSRCLSIASACVSFILLGASAQIAMAQRPTLNVRPPEAETTPLPTDGSAPDASRPRRLNAPADGSAPVISAAPAVTPPATTPSAPASLRAGEKYRIGPGDVIDVRVFNKPQLSDVNIRVNNDGTIKLPFIREVPAACRTEGELAEEIRTRLLKYQRKPEVDVIVRQFNSQPVTILGAVNSPARFQLQRQVRLLELLANASGPSARAGQSIQVLHTEAPTSVCEEPVAVAETADEAARLGLVSYNLNDTLKGLEQANPYVRPGDIVTVLEAEQIYMLSGVNKPGVIPLTLKEPLTISRAIVMSGGTSPGSDTGKVRILRQPPGSTTKTQITVNLNKIKKNQAEDIALQPNDVVDVPGVGGIKGALTTAINTLIPNTLNTLPYRILY